MSQANPEPATADGVDVCRIEDIDIEAPLPQQARPSTTPRTDRDASPPPPLLTAGQLTAGEAGGDSADGGDSAVGETGFLSSDGFELAGGTDGTHTPDRDGAPLRHRRSFVKTLRPSSAQAASRCGWTGRSSGSHQISSHRVSSQEVKRRRSPAVF